MGLLAALVIVVAGCGATARRSVALSRWLSTPVQRSVVLTLVPGENNVLNGFNFNGYAHGQVLVHVPRNWRVTVRCRNVVSSTRHSCAIVENSLSTQPAFPGAATPNPQVGLAPGRSASFSFLATRPGAYRIVCLVNGEELGGMWDAFEIGGTRRPSVTSLLAAP